MPVQLKDGDTFETAGFYGVVDDEENGIWISAKDGSPSVLLIDEGAALVYDNAWFSVKHEDGEYVDHVFTRTSNGKSVREKLQGK